MRKATDYRPVILRQAAQLFARKPFHEVLMEDLASQVGVAKGTIYRFFPNKDELYAAICFDWMDELTAELRRMAGQDLPVREGLDRIIRKIVEHFRGRRDFFQVLQRQESSQALIQRADFLQRRAAIVEVIAAWIRKGQERGELRRMDPATASNLLLGMLRGMLWFGDPKLDGAAVSASILGIFFDGLSTAKGANR